MASAKAEVDVSSQFPQPNLEETDNIIPGLFNLNLNIMFENDIHLVQDNIEGLKQRVKDEHRDVHNVLHDMIAIIKSKSFRDKIEFMSILENILESDSTNLNALADLEHFCRMLHIDIEADRYKKTKRTDSKR